MVDQTTVQSGLPLKLSIEKKTPSFHVVTIIIPHDIVSVLFEHIVSAQQPFVFSPGFAQGNVPISYIKNEFKPAIIAYLKEFLLKHAVINRLFKHIRTNKLFITKSPQLQKIFLEPGKDAQFIFDLYLFSSIAIQDWKFFPFKSPKRKNYRDIDRQVEFFVKEEQIDQPVHENISRGDWVHFSITIIDKKENPLIKDFEQNFWFCLADEEIESGIQKLFLGKMCGDIFITTNPGFHEYSYCHLDQGFSYLIKILEVIPQATFNFDRFKKHFKIKTNKDMHKKLIEVFSFHNDLSQRHCTVNETFKLLLNKHKFEAPKDLVDQQKNIILTSIKLKPDYTVYKKEKNFESYVKLLAERQVKESLFIDQFAHHENLQVTDDDVYNYLSLTLRPRIRQFIHFNLPQTKRGGQEIPISDEELKRYCLHEKAINHVIHHLTKE